MNDSFDQHSAQTTFAGDWLAAGNAQRRQRDVERGLCRMAKAAAQRAERMWPAREREGAVSASIASGQRRLKFASSGGLPGAAGSA